MECVRLFRFHVTATRNEAYLKPYPQEMLDYWFAMPAWMWIIWAVGVFGGLAGSLALLVRKRLAVGLFLASFLAAALSMTMGYFDKDAPRMEGAQFMPFIILGVAFLLIVYARAMVRGEVLR